MTGDDCPNWCEASHVFGTHPDDYLHLHQDAPLPVVALVQDHSGKKFSAPAIFDVVLFQFARLPPAEEVRGSYTQEEWVFVGGDDEQGFTVTRESANRIYRALGRLLAA